MKKPPSYWRRQVRRGKIRADDPRVIGEAKPQLSLDRQLAALAPVVEPRRQR